MPSFNRILVLAVLALSISVQSAPVGTERAHGIVPIERFPLPGTQVTEVSEEAVNVDLDERDFDDEDTDPSFLARRATKTSTTAPKAKVTKAPRLKTTKAAPKPKTTRAQTTKVKTTAKTTKGTKPAKTTKAATTAKPAKTPKVTKTKTSNTANTAKATGTATPSACPVKPAKKSRSFTARAFDYVAHLFRRDEEEFIGWHGTNSKTANDWVSNKNVKKPEGGTAQGNKELGPGLYLADDRNSSAVSATFNAQRNPGTMPMVCTIYAKSSATWRDSIHKVFIPEDIVGDTTEKEKQRVQRVTQALPNVPGNTVVRFALLDRRPNKVNGQMVIPESIASNFYAKKCFKVEGLSVAASDEAAANVGTKTWPGFDYKGDTLRREWKIAPENAIGCR